MITGMGSDALVLCLSRNHVFNMHRWVRTPICLSRQNNTQLSWPVKKQRDSPRPGHKEPQSFPHVSLETQWKTSLIQLSPEMNIYQIHLLTEKMNLRALNILFFLHKYHSILKVDVKCLRKMKTFDVEFFFKLLHEIIRFNNSLFHVSLRDQETKISWHLVVLQLIFLKRCVFV